MDNATFRENFPAFASEVKYPDTMIAFWAGIGDKLLNQVRWGDLYEHGLELFVAHKITLEAKNVTDGAAGRTPGLTTGVISSKSVGGVSVSYDTNMASLSDAGNYNMTQYGRDFWQLVQIVGMGGSLVI